jgi:hypothetical protein
VLVRQLGFQLMESSVAAATQRNQIVLTIIAEPTSGFDVMNLYSTERTTPLAAPVVALQNQPT